MLEQLPLVLLTLGLMGFALIARAVSRTFLTISILALLLGFGLSRLDLGLSGITQEHLYTLAEVALIVLLFIDAARTDVPRLISQHVWPARTLLLGMPFAFLGGAAVIYLLFPQEPLAIVLLLAALLVPTDAALGQSVVENDAVPTRLRRAVVVEAGLNDGIALPAILMLAAFAATGSDPPPMGWPLYGAMQITLGPAVGGAMGVAAGYVFLRAQAAQATSESYEGIAALSLAFGAYLLATMLGGNGFIAAFTCGIGFGSVVGAKCAFLFEFPESEGQVLSWAAFFLIGALLMPEALSSLSWPMFAAILISLFCVRPLAIALSLVGTDADIKSRLFIGWFGPRGLATALFALLVAKKLAPEDADFVLHFATNAVWISAILHGISTGPAIRAFKKLSAGAQ